MKDFLFIFPLFILALGPGCVSLERKQLSSHDLPSAYPSDAEGGHSYVDHPSEARIVGARPALAALMVPLLLGQVAAVTLTPGSAEAKWDVPTVDILGNVLTANPALFSDIAISLPASDLRAGGPAVRVQRCAGNQKATVQEVAQLCSSVPLGEYRLWARCYNSAGTSLQSWSDQPLLVEIKQMGLPCGPVKNIRIIVIEQATVIITPTGGTP